MNIFLQDQKHALTFYFFINTKSGNQKGKELLKLTPREYIIAREISQKVKIIFIDLFKEEEFHQSLQHIKEIENKEIESVRIIICGGDGTLNWVLNEFIRCEIDLSKIILGMLPIGTGNDFCRGLGQNKAQTDFSQSNIIQLVKKMVVGSIIKYDIWNVEIQTYQNGHIYATKNRQQYQLEGTCLKKMFVNFIGLGLDGRIVYTLQRYRTSNACFNIILYALVGIVNFFTPMKELKQKISHFTNSQINPSSFEIECNNLKPQTSEPISCRREDNLFFRGNSLTFKNGYRGFVCLNSKSYMTGLRNIWQTNELAVLNNQKMKFTPQSESDGKIEFIAFKSELNLALQRIMRSGAKITQGYGPFEVLFKKTHKDDITYMQIDGESIKIKNIKAIRICRAENISNHQINVLAYDSPPIDL